VEDALALLLLALDVLPAGANRAGRLGDRLAEDVRMPADELLVDRSRDLREVAFAALLQEQGEKEDLEEQVAKLVDELVAAAGERGVGDLVGLLDRVRDDRGGRLLTVPRTVAAQPLGQALELDERVGELVGGRASRRRSESSGTASPEARSRPGSSR
jgi:hypothetical protein